METERFIKNYNATISNAEISPLFSFLKKKNNSHLQKKINISLLGISNEMTVQGQWKISVTLGFNQQKLEISYVTTDSVMANDFENDQLKGLDNCVHLNEAIISDFVENLKIVA